MAKKRSNVDKTLAEKTGLGVKAGEKSLIEALDWKELAESLIRDIAPQLKKDLKAGLKAEDLYKKYANLAAARAITIALTEKNPKNAMDAIKEILGRVVERPAERRKQEVVHRWENLTDEQLDGMLKSVMADMPESALFDILEEFKKEDSKKQAE